MDNVIRHRMMAVFAVLVLTVANLAAQTITHVVQRGETLTSIATRYGTTSERLIELNSDAAQFVYVGMELKVPQRSQVNNQTTEVSMPNSSSSETEVYVQDNSSSYSTDNGGWKFLGDLGFGFVSKHTKTYRAELGMNYYFQEDYKGVFAGAGLGYTGCFTSGHEGTTSYSTDINILTIPLIVGYAVSSDDKKFALTPLGGIDLNIRLSGKTKVGNESYDMNGGDRLTVSARLGVAIRLWEFDIIGAYMIQLSDKQTGSKDSYPMVSIGWGF